eukprot:CAMPEP_0194178054 /NCGR_PEP_ID=MMETSP0154-20130528/11731_1 /TAXON_ID=1049557 /ORGANISM="Thalassiothrix antarctica, Strain L6-D1" /LENGTH=327 /DNA_ID=CAMNT_0038892871 /DNA_START=166 /DNA_END=1149 /DNA_ORIENTATION=+
MATKKSHEYSGVSSDESGKSLSIINKTSWKQRICGSSGIIVALLVSFAVGFYAGGVNDDGKGMLKMDDRKMNMDESSSGSGGVIVIGATGRTGSLLYHELKKRGVDDVRAFVRDAEKARIKLGCLKCDKTEGIYVGDATIPEDLERAMSNGAVTKLAIAIGASPTALPDIQRKVEFDSVVYSVEALAKAHGGTRKDLRVVYCSSMGTEKANPPSFFGDLPHWKLNSEAFLSSSAIPNTVIVKPCGLPEKMSGKNSTLLVGHNGTITEGSPYHSVSRADVASVMAEALMMPNECGRSTTLRFDLCSIPGPATTDLKSLIDSARWDWDK